MPTFKRGSLFHLLMLTFADHGQHGQYGQIGCNAGSNRRRPHASFAKGVLFPMARWPALLRSARSSASEIGFTMPNLRRVALVFSLLVATVLLTGGMAKAVSDTTPPSIVSLSFSPTSVDTSWADVAATVTARITDDLSGFSGGFVYVYSPSKKQSRYVDLNTWTRTSGTGLDGAYSGTVTLPRYSETGTWTIRTVYLQDAAGNIKTYSNSDLVAQGFSTALNVSATQSDGIAPSIASLSFSPSSVDTSSSDATVAVTARITDDLSGFSYGFLNFCSPSGNQYEAYIAYRVSGTDTDGIYEASVTFPRYSETGTWTLNQIELFDRTDNRRYYDADSLSALGFPTSLNVGAAVLEAPAGVTAAPGNGQADVSWSAPASSSTITKYTVTASPGGQTATITGNPPATGLTVTGLTNGTSYTFTVNATSSDGTGPASDPSAAVTPRTSPTAPSAVTAAAGDRSAAVSWQAPSSNGGAAITSYTVTANPGGASATVYGAPPVTTATVTGLANGTAYTFTVTASNAAGNSTPSSASSAVTPLAPTPDAPQNVMAVPGARSGMTEIRWSAPAYPGTSAIASYTVYRAAAGGTLTTIASTTATSYSDTGLNPTVVYSYAVAAVNNSGEGSKSTAVAVVPTGGPSVSVSDATAVKPTSGGTANAVFRISVSGTLLGPVTAHYSTADGTAKAATDYQATSGDVTFQPGGPSSTQILVPVIGGPQHGLNTHFRLQLSSVTGAQVSDGVGDGDAINGNGLVPIGAADASVVRSASATTQLKFPVSLAGPPLASGEKVSVKVATVDGTATIAHGDYLPVNGTLMFSSSTPTTQLVGVTIPAGSTTSGNKTLSLKLTTTSGAAVVDDSRAVGTIVAGGSTPLPSISVRDLVVQEPGSDTGTAAVRITVGQDNTAPIKVAYTTVDGTATAGQDYSPVSGTLTIPAHTTAVTLAVPIRNDQRRSDNKSFIVKLSKPTGATLGDPTATVTIVDPEGPYHVRVGDVSGTRAIAGPSSAVFPVSVARTPDAGDSFTVDYSTADGTAVAGNGDYTPVQGELTFTSTTPTTQYVTVSLAAATASIPTQFLSLNLSDPSPNAVIADGTGVARVSSYGPTAPGAWTAQSSGVGTTLSDVKFTDINDGWTVGDAGVILATTNAGATWTPQTSGTSNNLVAVDFVDTTHGWAVGANGTILRTTDGVHWAAQTSHTVNQLNGVSFASASVGWAVGIKGTVLATTDGGAHWTPQTPSSGATDLKDVTFLDATHGWAAGGKFNTANTGVIIATSDGGAHWTTQVSNLPQQVFAIRMADLTHGAAAGANGTFATTHDGTTWQRATPSGTTTLSAVAALDANTTVIAGTGGTVTISGNAGGSWTPQPTGTTNGLRGLSFLDEWHGWAVGENGTILHFS